MTPEVQFVTDHSATEDHGIGAQKQRACFQLGAWQPMIALCPHKKELALNSHCSHRDGADGVYAA